MDATDVDVLGLGSQLLCHSGSRHKASSEDTIDRLARILQRFFIIAVLLDVDAAATTRSQVAAVVRHERLGSSLLLVALLLQLMLLVPLVSFLS